MVREFDSLGTSRIDALLKFGEVHNLCFGIEYVDRRLLTEAHDVQVRSMSVHDAINTILGQEALIIVEPSSGVIEIKGKELPGEKGTIFDYVVPRFDTKRASVQAISTALRMQLVVDLNPQVTGFAGSYPSGDVKDEAGPFSEHDRSIRYLLNQLVVQSRGGAWIASVRGRLAKDLTLVQHRSVWTVVEYGVPKSGYEAVLNAIANDLGSDQLVGAGEERH